MVCHGGASGPCSPATGAWRCAEAAVGERSVQDREYAVSGRVSSGGEKSLGDTPISFDLRFEAAILPPQPTGSDLGESGGAQGAAYLAYGDKVEGKVKMILDGDAWRFADEDLETVW